jgi:hypothetical protein
MIFWTAPRIVNFKIDFKLREIPLRHPVARSVQTPFGVVIFLILVDQKEGRSLLAAPLVFGLVLGN